MSLRRHPLLVLAFGIVVGSTLTAAAPTASGTRAGPVKPIIGKPVTSPPKPLAGQRFSVSFRVTRSDTGTPLTRGRMTCDPSVAGKVIRHVESFRAGTARLSFVVPTSAAGGLLKVKVTIKTASQSATRVVTFRVTSAGAPSLTIGDASVVEGNAGTTTLSFAVRLSPKATKTVSVSYATADRTAKQPADYTRSSGTLTFAPGETAKTIAVSVVADTAMEQDETFAISLFNPVNADISNGTATGTITNDDTAVPVTAGSYKGLLDGNFIFFDVLPDRTLTGMRFNYFREDCSGGIYIYGTLEMGSRRLPIGADGSFRFTRSETGTVSGAPASFYFEIGGRFEGINATGTVLATSQFDHQGTHYNCSSGTKTWTASLQP
jgi:hypothetical protein